jgi:hypothetical protein
MVTQSTFTQIGFAYDKANQIMQKLETLGVAPSTTKRSITYVQPNTGKVIEQTMWVKAIDINSAIKALNLYLSKKSYSSRVNVTKWMDVLALLRTLKAKGSK